MSLSARPALRRSAVAAGASLALLAAAFAGYGAWTRKGPVEYARGGTGFLSDTQVPIPQVTSAQGSGRRTAAATLSASEVRERQLKQRELPLSHMSKAQPVEVPRRVPTAGRASAPGPVGSAGRTAAPAPAPAPVAVPAGPVEPVPGRYELRVSGSEDVKFGPFSFCGRDLPASSELVVAPAAGEPAGSYNFDVRYYPGDAGKHDERRIYRYTAGAVQQGFEGATVTCGGIRQSSDVAYTPVQTRVRLPLTVGQAWSGTGGDADRTETYRSRVTGTDVVAVAGTRVPVYVIETETEFTGAEHGTRTQRWWYSPAHAMPLRWSDRTEGGRSGATYTSEITVSVVSLPVASPPGAR
jgi:hypothetical protein